MHRYRTISAIILILIFSATSAFGQKNQTGNIKGRVRVEVGNAANIQVIVRQGEQEVARTETDRKGQFSFTGMAPGNYTLTFRKTGLSVAEVKNIVVVARKTRDLGDRVALPIDEGTIAVIKGSIFDADGRSVEGARVELMRVEENGTLKRVDGKISNDAGEFAFRLRPVMARFRVTAKVDGMPPVSQEVNVEGAAIYRVALSVKPSAP